MAAAGLLRSRPWFAEDCEETGGVDAVEVVGGIPPVAWAAANSADIEDIGSELELGISRPAARAASRSAELGAPLSPFGSLIYSFPFGSACSGLRTAWKSSPDLSRSRLLSRTSSEPLSTAFQESGTSRLHC